MNFIHRFVPGKSERLLLLLHGTGGNEDDLIPLGQALDPAAGLLSPRGRILENGMPRFFRRLAEGVFDEADLIRRSEELAQFIQWAARHYKFRIEKVIAIGYSNGANIAASLLLLHPDVLGAAALLRAMVPLRPKQLPDLSGRPVLLVAGKQDAIVPVVCTNELTELLRRAGARVTICLESAGHALIPGTVETVRRWLKEI